MSEVVKNSTKISAVIIVLSFLLIINCGIESSVYMDDLNHPVISSAELKIDGGSCVIEIDFVGYNFEKNFSGYNVYITDEESASGLRTEIGKHINSDGSLNTEIQDEYLISRSMTTDEFPTITFDDMWNAYNSATASLSVVETDLAAFYDPLSYDSTYAGDPSLTDVSEPESNSGFTWRPLDITYKFSWDIEGKELDCGLSYYIVGITAFNETNHVESKPAVDTARKVD